MGQLQKIEAELTSLGYQIVAISPDRPGKLKEIAARSDFQYRLFSDSLMNASKAFGLAFQVPEELVSTYKNRFNIDLEADSGQKHHQLPVPAIYLIGADGKVLFQYVNPDYRVRLHPDIVLAAARALKE